MEKIYYQNDCAGCFRCTGIDVNKVILNQNPERTYQTISGEIIIHPQLPSQNTIVVL